MKNIIYGKGRHQREIEYVFDDMEISYYIGDFEAEEERQFTIDTLAEEQDYRVIICSPDQEKKEQRLIEKGLQRGRDYIYAEELYLKLNGNRYMDISEVPQKIVVWGTGKTANILRHKYRDLEILYYIDNNSALDGTRIDGIEVRNPNRVEDWKAHYIIVAVTVCEEITEYLKNRGLKERQDFIRFSQIHGAPSEMIQTVCTAREQHYPMCMQMFQMAFIGVGGEVHLCCPHMISNLPVGNLADNTWEECWNSSKAKIMRLSLVNGTFCFCDKTQCNHFNWELESPPSEQNNRYRLKPLAVPKEMVLAFDSSCNLKCTSCRKDFKISPTRAEQAVLQKITDHLREAAQQAEVLVVSGNGDPIFSKWYQQLWLKGFQSRRKSIQLITNGLLFNKKTWEKIEDIYESISVDISIDAATKETYEGIRVGGNFDILMANLVFIGELRTQGRIKQLIIRFVVQRKNYREMPLFVELGKRIHADKVYFCKIANWNLYDDAEFDQMSMFDKNDNMRPELKEILKDPVFDSPIVDFSNIQR